MNNTYFLLGAAVLVGGYFVMTQKNSMITSGVLTQAAEFIAKKEGFRSKVYLDTAGKKTIGYGHLLKSGETFANGITQKQAQDLLAQDLKIAESAVNKLVKVDLTANQKISLISFVFNIGGGAFADSTLLKKLNSGDKTGAAQELDRWVYSGGQVTNGLVIRRAEEKRLFLA